MCIRDSPYTDPLVLVCDEEGKYDGKEKNRALVSDSGEIYDVVFGTFFIAGIGDEEFTSVPDNLTEKYLEKYKNPHAFIKSDTGKYIIVELPVEISKGITSVEGYAETYGNNKKETEKEL